MNANDTPAIEATDAVDVEAEPRSVILTRIVPITALVLVVGFVALILYSVVRPADTSGPAGIAINESGALVQLDPRPAEDFTLELFNGDQVQLSDFRGSIVVINFWASWCPPCREEARDLERAWQELQGENVVFLGLNVWDERDDALAYIDEFDVSYRNGIVEEGGAAVDFGVRGIPETFIINEEGLVMAKFIGPVQAGQLIETVQQIRE